MRNNQNERIYMENNFVFEQILRYICFVIKDDTFEMK